MPALIRLLVFSLVRAIALGLFAWRLCRHGQLRLAALEGVLFKRVPEGWMFDSPYPRVFGRRRWTYLLTDAQKDKLAERLRRWQQTATLVTIGLIILLAIPLAVWVEKLPDLLGLLLTGAPRAWLTLFLGFVLLYATLAVMFFIAKKHLIPPVLRDARRIGRAGPVSVIRLMAELTSRRELRRRIIVATLAGLLACVPAYLSPSSVDAELLLVMAVSFGLLDVWYVALLVIKLRAERSPPHGGRGAPRQAAS